MKPTNPFNDHAEMEPAPSVYHLSVFNATWNGFGGVVLAGAVYGLVVTCVYFGILVYQSPNVKFDLESVIGYVYYLVIGAAISIAAGICLAGFLGILMTFVICLFNRSMNYIWSPITAAGVMGGAVGFLATSSVPMAGFQAGDPTLISIGFLTGPLPAMVFGQIGAVRMAVKQIRVHYLRMGHKVEYFWLPRTQQSFRQFGVKQLLVLTAWCAALTLILNGISQVSMPATLVLVSYFPIQWLVYYPVQVFLSGFVKRTLADVRA